MTPLLTRLLNTSLKETVSNVRIKGETLEDSDVIAGLRQEDHLLTIFYNMLLEKSIKDSHINREGHMMYKSLCDR